MTRKIASAIRSLSDPATGLAPSHWGHPGYMDAAFLYDKAVDALVLNAAGDRVGAKSILDYFARRLRIPMNEIRRYADANGIYGMLKLFPSVDDPRAVGFVNAFNIRSADREGQGQLEYWTTPGPLAFLIFAFLQVDAPAYRDDAARLGEILLLMQRPDGAIIDGDRDVESVNTEPHMDGFSAFLMLYDVTRDAKWKDAADRAWAWFVKNVYRPDQGIIDQGTEHRAARQIFATDTYSWTIAGPAGERIPLDVQERLADRMLRQGLSRVTLELPDGETKTLTLVDFADGRDMRIIADRGGFHLMGSVEWAGGVILALQKMASRFWGTGEEAGRGKAVFYKALAEYFTRQAMNSFYAVDGIRGVMTFYATGQWVPTGHGWRTPYFYVKDPLGRPVVRGGSTVGAWPVLAFTRHDPFQLGDRYGDVYDAIPLDAKIAVEAAAYVDMIAKERVFVESVPDAMDETAGEIPELWRYDQRMFLAFAAGDYYAAIMWAEKVVTNASWIRLAREEQARKTREVGGLIDYPWGTPLKDADKARRAIHRYPILNEVGAAMWGLAVSHFRLGNYMEAKAWIRTIIEAVPGHQIFAPDGPGYWNALVSWEINPGGLALDAEMGALYRDVLEEKGLVTALPQTYPVKFEARNPKRE